MFRQSNFQSFPFVLDYMFRQTNYQSLPFVMDPHLVKLVVPHFNILIIYGETSRSVTFYVLSLRLCTWSKYSPQPSTVYVTSRRRGVKFRNPIL